MLRIVVFEPMSVSAESLSTCDFEIVPATWRDLGTLRTLEQVCFAKDAWPLLDLIAVLTLSGVVRLKAEIDSRMVGFVAGELRASEDLAWIATIGVFPEYRRNGIASALLAACERQLAVSRVRLSVRQGNTAAINLYQNFGYQRVGLWPAYYRDGADAIVFEKLVRSGL